MKERPILFSAPMVRALLDGSKTQTRRIVKPQPPADTFRMDTYHHPGGSHYFWAWKEAFSGCELHAGWKPIPCPYGQPGDRLWVRETFAIVPRTAYAHSDGVQQALRPDDDHDAAIYREGWTRSRGGFRWRPSIHMPRWASRITLEVTGVRVERLQDISEEDALAEGRPVCPSCGDSGWVNSGPDGGWQCKQPMCGDSDRDWYCALWEQINGPGSWDANPWVWAVEFKRVVEVRE